MEPTANTVASMSLERPTEATPSCYRHPDRPTYLRCSECGRPICSACSIDAAVGQRCPECVRRQGRQKVIDGRAAVTARNSATGSPVTLGIVAVTVAVFLVTWMGPIRLANSVVRALEMSNAAVARGEWWRLFTVTLLHAGFLHILFNMWALWVLGPQIEREVGGVRFLSLYLASAAAGSSLAYFMTGPQTVGVGASGAIFGLFGVWLAGAYRRRHTAYGRFLFSQLLFLLVINAALPLMIPNIEWQAHLGGLVAGMLMGEAWSRLGSRRNQALHLGIAMAVIVVSVGATLLL